MFAGIGLNYKMVLLLFCSAIMISDYCLRTISFVFNFRAVLEHSYGLGVHHPDVGCMVPPTHQEQFPRETQKLYTNCEATVLSPDHLIKLPDIGPRGRY